MHQGIQDNLYLKWINEWINVSKSRLLPDLPTILLCIAEFDSLILWNLSFVGSFFIFSISFCNNCWQSCRLSGEFKPSILPLRWYNRSTSCSIIDFNDYLLSLGVTSNWSYKIWTFLFFPKFFLFSQQVPHPICYLKEKKKEERPKCKRDSVSMSALYI